MATDDERRRVAERLRECKSHVDGAGWFWLIDEVAGAHIVASSEERLKSGANRLADLIEPTPTSSDKLRHYSDTTATCDVSQSRRSGVDREALLALAEEMERDGRVQRERQKAGERWFIDGLDVMEYARRIREACGVVS